MKNAMLKFAGLFIEKIPVDDDTPAASAVSNTHAVSAVDATPVQPLHGHFPQSAGALPPQTRQPTQLPDKPQRPVVPPHHRAPQQTAPDVIPIALRALVPQEYAGYLAAYGLHVIAAAADLAPAQASAWGAQVLVLSAECLGMDTAMLTSPAIPTVFITAHPMMVASVPGVVQVTEPLRASEVAEACRQARADWTRGHL